VSLDRRLWQPKLFLPAVALLFLVYGLEMFLSARLESQTFDEPAHLYAGYSYWLRSDFGVNPEHPPLVKLVATLPLLVDKPAYPEPTNRFFRADSALGGMRLLGRPAAGRLLSHARTAVSVFAFLLAVLLTVAAREMFGETVALFALALFVFDPLLVAHGPLLGTDVGATCCIFAAVYAFYRYVKRPLLVRLGVCAVAAGLSLAAKHSAILIFPILMLLAVTEVVWHRPAADPEGTNPPDPQSWRWRAVRMVVSLVVIAAVSVTILWAFYGFRYAARPGGAQITPPTAVYLQGLHHPVEARTIGFAERHHLLPEAYLYGLTDVTILSQDGRVMYLFGKMYPQGRWFYFPAAFLIKSTIGFLLLLLLIPFSKALWRSDVRRRILDELNDAVVRPEADDGRVHVRAGACDHARGERRRVHLVLRVQDHGDVERTRLLLAWRLAVQHREEVLRVREARVGIDRLEALPAPVIAADDRRRLRDQSPGLARLRLAVVRIAVRIGEGERRDRSAQHVHRQRRSR